jgi:acetyl esterase/lipase
MVGFTGDNPEFEPTGAATPYPGVSSRVRAVINMYGIANMLTRQEVATDGTPTGKFRTAGPAKVFGASDPAAPVYRAASPVTHVTKATPPVLILHGNLDTTVDRDQSHELARVLAKHGVPHELVMVEGAGHTFDFQKWGKKRSRAICGRWRSRFWRSTWAIESRQAERAKGGQVVMPR